MSSKSEKEKKGLTGITQGTDDGSKISEEQFKKTSWISVTAIIVSVLIMFGGAFLAVHLQNESKKETTARLVYDDIDRMNWTLHNLTQMIDTNSRGLPVIFTPIYSENGVYYTSRSDIALLDQSLARNISIYYTDLGYAEIYRKSILEAIGPNAAVYAPTQIEISYWQYRNAIFEAHDLRPQILDELEKIYHISKSLPNRFNRYDNT